MLKFVLLPLIMRRLPLFLLCGLLAAALLAQKHKKKADEEPRPQALEKLPDPPEAVAVETARLSFQVSPLSDKGLLSQQVHDALKALSRLNHGAPIVKLRAFVAGSGDLRRVKEIVAEDFTAKKQPLPAVSAIQAGALPLTGAQVVIEAISTERRAVNPNGLAFLSAVQSANSADTVGRLQNSLNSAGISSSDVLRVTCFLSSIDDVLNARAAVASTFPSAAGNFVKLQRAALEPQVVCEAVARITTPVQLPVALARDMALISAPKLVLTATQLVFGDQDSDFQLAYQRLAKTIMPLGASFQSVIWSGAYALTRAGAGKIDTLQWNVLDRTKPAAHTALLVEGLPSIDATAAIELIAALP